MIRGWISPTIESSGLSWRRAASAQKPVPPMLDTTGEAGASLPATSAFAMVRVRRHVPGLAFTPGDPEA
jgi:hypothetical protein